MPHVNWIFIDPARRDKQGGKVFAIADCEPNVVELESLLLEKAEHGKLTDGKLFQKIFAPYLSEKP